MKLTAPVPAAEYLAVSVDPVPTLAHTAVRPVMDVAVGGAAVVIASVLAAALLVPQAETDFTARLPEVNPGEYCTATHELSVAASVITALAPVTVHLKLTAVPVVSSAAYLTVSVGFVPTLAHTLARPLSDDGAGGAVVVMASVLAAVLVPQPDTDFTEILPDVNDPFVYLTAIHTLSGPDAPTMVIVAPLETLHL